MKVQRVKLLDLARAELPTLEVVDVGAMWLGAENVSYKALLRRGASRVVGFEPVQAECDRLNGLGLPNQTYLPYFVGDGTERTFYFCSPTTNSSLYEPNFPLLRMFATLSELFRVVSTSRVQTRRLDDIPEVPRADFLKIDVQGGDLDVIRGATRLLGTCVVVQTEVEFVPLYKDQPLFADVDAEMRRHGFLLHKFGGTCGRAFLPVINEATPHAMLSQAIWADAVYVRDFTRMDEWSPEQLLKTAVIMNDVYDSFDLAAAALRKHDEKTKGTLFTRFIQKMTGR